MVPAIEAHSAAMRNAALKGFATATDLADAHEVVGKAVAHCIDAECDLADCSLETLKTFHPGIEQDVYQVLTLEGSIAARDHIGGTAPNQVRAAIAVAQTKLNR